MKLPDDCVLAYYLPAEAYYADTITKGYKYPTLMVSAHANGGGCAWEFTVISRDLGGMTTQIRMFSDAYDALTDIPEFFAEMVADKPSTLSEVRSILDGLGAKDITERTGPVDD